MGREGAAVCTMRLHFTQLSFGVSDALGDVVEVDLGVGAVELGYAEKGVHSGGAFFSRV